MIKTLKDIVSMSKLTFKKWLNDRGPKLAAALAYYCVISLAPLLLITIGVASLFFKEELVRGEVTHQISRLVGGQATEAIQGMLINTRKSQGVLATVIGLVTMIFGASGVFGELQDSLNLIWKVPKTKISGLKAFIKSRFLSFAMVLAIGFLLTISLLISAAIGAFTRYLGGNEEVLGAFWQALDFLLSFSFTTFLFTLIFKVLPNTRIPWRTSLMGGLITSALFSVGKVALGFYLGRAAASSGYGAAGAVIILLIWIYYTAQILFLGAELTYVSTKYKRPGATGLTEATP